MRTLLLAPELFHAEGGIARILRLYLKALCDSAQPGDSVASVALNDSDAPDPRMARYSSPALQTSVGCAGSKFRLVRQAATLAENCERILCGHLHLLPVAWMVRQISSSLEYDLLAHGIEVWRPYSVVETQALLQARRIFCVSDYTRRQMLRFCPALDPARLIIVPNALDPFFAPSAETTAGPPPASNPRILSVSRLTTADNYKGIDTLIEALPLIRRMHPEARLRIVGSGDDTARLLALVARHQMETAVDFCGLLSDEQLRAEYAACDIFALPSRREGFGLVYLEAMAHGKPCLGARAGGAPEVISDRAGVLAEYGNITDIAFAVSDLVRHPRRLAEVRAQADSFNFAAFKSRIAAALA
jgi:glycosyltransferase involved in cell wall biosynthesis